ncbi:MBL fold metallo-hydrolase [Vibrio sp. HN007]|uniref:MBL fold metallo-hydrolase n=1 Tax=Vibrio iocasae TaxID=3098914 RepID=UPI0035D415D0
MKIHHLRSATFVIESSDKFILIDPMLSDKGALPPFSVFRYKAVKNPIVDLPANADEILSKVTHALITHSQTFNFKPLQHSDHLDAPGEAFLIERNIPIATPAKDKAYLEKYGMTVEQGVGNWETVEFAGGKLTAVPALHGHGWVSKVSANGCGFYLELPGEPSIYVSGDTVLTDDVKRALTELQPDVAVVAAGQARLDVGQALLMPKDEVMEFISMAPGKVVANHMEALNHCPIDRKILRDSVIAQGFESKVLIPADGEVLEV